MLDPLSGMLNRTAPQDRAEDGDIDSFILLLGSDLAEAATIAEGPRDAVERTACDGLSVTISCGVGASAAGAPFRCEEVFERADSALWEAERTGRNRVRGEPEPALV